MFRQFSPLTCQVFSYILKHRPVSRADIGKGLDKTAMSVKRAVESLEEAGLVTECGIGQSTGGRKPILYTVDSSRYYLGAVNISTTYCEVAVMNLCMEILVLKDFPLNSNSVPDQAMDQVAELFGRILEELDLSKGQILGVGVSVFSSFNRESGKVIRPIILYLNENWVDYPVVRELERRLELPVEMEKGTNAAAMLEYEYGKARDSERMLYILCAMNIRSAVVMKGELQSIAPYYEDAFGHMTINYDGEPCRCGKYGCVDCYTTIPAILEQFRVGIKKGRSSILAEQADAPGFSFYDICRASEEGDALSCEVLTSAASMLGLALSNYIDLFCPDMVILSGLLIKESALYFRVAVDTAKQKSSYGVGRESIRFERRGSFPHSITSGAGAILLERLMGNGVHFHGGEIPELVSAGFRETTPVKQCQ